MKIALYLNKQQKLCASHLQILKIYKKYGGKIISQYLINIEELLNEEIKRRHNIRIFTKFQRNKNIFSIPKILSNHHSFSLIFLF